MEKTNQNLTTAFAGESQANRKYLFFAEQAVKEGHRQISRLFRAAAEAETVHARNHLSVLGAIGSTLENLKEAIEGEHYEFTKMYPEFISQASATSNKNAETSFRRANSVEMIHHKLLNSALESLTTHAEMKEGAYYVCQVCGNTVLGEAPDICPICGVGKTRFKKVD